MEENKANKENNENKEKKKRPRRKHYRGRNTDKSKEQDSRNQPAESDRNEKRDKPQKRDRRERQGKRSRQEDKASRENKELQEDVFSEEDIAKLKHEPDEVIFEFTWADAWGLYGTGYHIVIKDNPDKMYLSWSVDLGYDEMKIGQRLQEFLDDMKQCGLSSWDGRRYTKQGIFDGDTWSVKVNSLKVKCEAQGTNEYPPEWKQFLKCLHEKWKIPVSKREQWF